MFIAFCIITGIILIKYKPIYKISIFGEEMGYVKNKQAFEETVKQNILENKEKNIDNIDIKVNPQYELKFVNRGIETNEKNIAEVIEDDVIVTYKYYDVNLNDKSIDLFNTVEEAEELVNKIKEDNQDKQLKLSILEKYTENVDEANTTTFELAKIDVQKKVEQNILELEKERQEEERINKMPEINGIKLAYVPTSTGVVSSRYGSVESVRNLRTHTGLDIASPIGTEIKAIASGKVTLAGMQNGYGNIVKIDHGNGVETYYAHCNKLLVKQGEYVEAGKVIATVGTTGNSTGPHLHLEIRVNGKSVNPQKYLYN